MKFNFDMKNKKVGLEADVEKIVEKAINNKENQSKDKFNTKHNANKEILEIKHQQKMEREGKNQEKKNWFQKMQEEKRRTKELELEYKRKEEEEQMKILKTRIIISIVLGLLGIMMITIGFLLGSASGNPNSGWYAVACVGFFPLMIGFFCLGDNLEKPDKNKKKRR